MAKLRSPDNSIQWVCIPVFNSLVKVFVVLEIIGGGPLLTEMYKCQDSTEIASVAKHNFVHDTTQRFLIWKYNSCWFQTYRYIREFTTEVKWSTRAVPLKYPAGQSHITPLQNLFGMKIKVQRVIIVIWQKKGLYYTWMEKGCGGSYPMHSPVLLFKCNLIWRKLKCAK